MYRQKIILYLLLGVSLFHASAVRGQSSSDSTLLNSSLEVMKETKGEIHPVRLGIVIGGAVGIVTIAHVQNYNSWWKGTTSSFHFGDDGTKYLHADKLGHFMFTYVASDMMGHSFVWAGLQQRTAFLYGGGLALAFQTYVEIEDAFHDDLGFSTGDQIANTLGAAMPLLQHEVPFFSKLKFKWSAIPSLRFQRGRYRTIFDDYESQYYWISANVKEMCGISSPFVPDFLNIAVGIGVKNLDFQGNGDRELYLALDVDMEKLPGEGAFLQTLKHALNYIHFPAPAIRFTPHVVMYGLRF